MKNKIVIIIAAICLSAALAACSVPKNDKADTSNTFDTFSYDSDAGTTGYVITDPNDIQGMNSFDQWHTVRVYVDPKTGVNYLIYKESTTGGITLRVDPSGKPIVTPDAANAGNDN